MNSGNPFVKLMIFGRLKKMLMTQIGHKMKTIDKNIIRGVFLKRNKDFDEDYEEFVGSKTLSQKVGG